MDTVSIVFGAVVLGRFLLPLLIPVYPLPAIVACLVLDGVDQSIFQAFGYDPPGYQGYDKAMDVYYLAIAYMATLRNWTELNAFRVGRFLYFYRLVGVVAFELTHARPLLLLFPNTFEYFFIAYEAIRTRWNPLRWGLRWWIGVAALIWVVIKLPQEYWIHIAQLDVTDTLAAHTWLFPVLGVVAMVAAGVVWVVVIPRLPHPDWTWRMRSDPLPEAVDTAKEQAAWRAETARVWSAVTAEKVALVGLLAVVFAQTLPDVRASNTQLFIGVAAFVVVNAAITLAAARRAISFESLAVTFVVRFAVNIGLVVLASWLLGREGGGINEGHTVFFVFLLSLLTALHDRFQPVYAWRRKNEEAVAAG